MKLHSLLLAGLLVAAGLPASAGASEQRARSAPAEEPGATVIDAELVAARGVASAFAHVRAARWRAAIRAARARGLSVGSRYRAIDVFVVVGRAGKIRALADTAHFSYLETNRPLVFATSTSHRATRGRDVLDGAARTPSGKTIDGRGIGIAIVDSGVDGTHPDLRARMAGNVKVVCTSPQFVAGGGTGGFTTCRSPKTYVPLSDSDTVSAGGHGTHVAGIAAGDGSASSGSIHGAAPGASIYGVSVGTASSIENGLDGLQWVLDNHAKVTPRIRVANMSWGSAPRAYDPNDPLYSALYKMQDALVGAGVTVVVSAGNSGGTGAEQMTYAECINPTPGVICVASYDDQNSGTRDGKLAPSSSRGARDMPASWPDIAAPGARITSTCRITLPACSEGGEHKSSPEPNLYATLSGTSMAAPHVSGIAAQLLQVKPTLTPGEIETLLESSAYKFVAGEPYSVADPAAATTSSPDKGHGLVDALAAVQRLLTP